jgi:small subunit ribosomal protein S1
MSWSQHLRSAGEFVKIGDEIEAVILTLDREERKMSLGMKQLTPDPWNMIMEKYSKGSKHTGTVRNFTNFGVFVELEEGVDGLVHISDLSWSKKIKHPSEFCKVGEKMDVVVLEIDGENRRLSLGHKQLEENPWDVFETVFTVDSVHKGTITSVNDKGALVGLTYGVEGFCPARHLAKADGTTLKNEETADFKVIEFSKDAKRIVVSHARLHEEVKEEARKTERATKKADSEDSKKAVKKVKDSQEKTTLGDYSALSDLKDKLDAKNNK